MRDDLPPEVIGALNLAERHERRAWTWCPPGRSRTTKRLLSNRHRAKAQKLRRRAEVLLARREGA